MTHAGAVLRQRVEVVADAAGLAACQALRARVFTPGAALDADPFDAASTHLLVTGVEGEPRATLRYRFHRPGSDLTASYTGQRYDLSPLRAWPAPILEIGRFCALPGGGEAEALRLLWGRLARVVDEAGVSLLIGCSSFPGLAPPCAAFAWLAENALGPAALRPGVLAAETIPLNPAPHDRRTALGQMPTLLRTYLGMNGWTGDHAVIDRALGTLHVFTAVEVARIPPARARALRALSP